MKRVILPFYVFFLIAFLSGCTGGTLQSVQWEYIVPADYQGFLVIRYNCPGGQPLPRLGNRISVTFDQRGIYCTNETSFATSGPLPRAVTTTGQAIPFVTDAWAHTGWGICCGHSRVIGGQTVENPGADLILDVLWVGQFQPRPRSEPEFPELFDPFWKDRFLSASSTT